MSSFDLATISHAINNPVANRVQDLVQKKLTNERLEKVIDKIVEKAEKGDAKALDYLLTLGGGRREPATVVVQQFYEASAEPRKVVNKTERSPLQMIIGLIGVAGQLTPAAISQQTGLRESEVIRELDDHPELFSVIGTQYSLINNKKAKR